MGESEKEERNGNTSYGGHFRKKNSYKKNLVKKLKWNVMLMLNKLHAKEKQSLQKINEKKDDNRTKKYIFLKFPLVILS